MIKVFAPNMRIIKAIGKCNFYRRVRLYVSHNKVSDKIFSAVYSFFKFFHAIGNH